MTPERVIGIGNTLPWHLPSDLAMFKDITMITKNVVVGRRTYESILARNGKPLIHRHHIVLTNTSPAAADSVQFVRSFEEAIAAIVARGGRACVIGGEQVYKLFLPIAERVYITTVYTSERLEGDAYFPMAFHPEEKDTGWKCVLGGSNIRKWDERDEFSSSFSMYERVS